MLQCSFNLQYSYTTSSPIFKQTNISFLGECLFGVRIIDAIQMQQMINNLMLQTTSQKIVSSTKTRLKININKPPQIAIHPSPSPVFARKRSVSKSNKGSRQGRSKQGKQRQRGLKYSVIMPSSPKSAISVVESEVQPINLVTIKMQDSKKTVYRDRSINKNQQHLHLHLKTEGQNGSVSKRGVDTSRKERSKSPWIERKDQNYVYWKKKAHQYLQLNIKLMNQVRRLTKDNQRLNNLVQESKIQLALKEEEQSSKIYNQALITQEIRNISSIYLNKIEGLQKQCKRKEMVIHEYDLKLREMGAKLRGDAERIKLIGKLQQQISTLKEQIAALRNIDYTLKVDSMAKQSTGVPWIEEEHR